MRDFKSLSLLTTKVVLRGTAPADPAQRGRAPTCSQACPARPGPPSQARPAEEDGFGIETFMLLHPIALKSAASVSPTTHAVKSGYPELERLLH